jgi:AcrR family transcriptional regulator
MLIDMSIRVERKIQTRAQILAAARQVIRDKGFAATTARDVAAGAGVAVGTVFLHFASMAVLAETLLDETVGAALEPALAAPPAELVVDEMVRVASALYAGYAAEPELARQVLAGSLFPAASGQAGGSGVSQARLGQFEDWVVAQVERAVSAGEIEPIDGRLAFVGFFALYFGLLVAALRGELGADQHESILRDLLGRLLRPTGGVAR